MSQGMIEHANLTVSDVDRSSQLFQTLLGWRERWRGEAMNGGETIHVGDERSYLALYTDRQPHERFGKGAPEGVAAPGRALPFRLLISSPAAATRSSPAGT